MICTSLILKSEMYCYLVIISLFQSSFYLLQSCFGNLDSLHSL